MDQVCAKCVQNVKSNKNGPATNICKSMGYSTLSGGGSRDRTGDLMTASHALSQLSYTPTVVFVLCERGPRQGGIIGNGLAVSQDLGLRRRVLLTDDFGCAILCAQLRGRGFRMFEEIIASNHRMSNAALLAKHRAPTLNRRQFIQCAGGALGTTSLGLGCAHSARSSVNVAQERELVLLAIDVTRSVGARYADARVTELWFESVGTRELQITNVNILNTA